MIRHLAVALALALALSACSEAGGDSDGTAQVWVTHDRGSRVIVTATVPAGLTVMQALDRAADVETRYGGRFVQAINGVGGSLARRRDWFYFVNGIEAERGAAEYRLRPGEVAWWDFRSWSGRMREPVVVGAFPEPFVHGYGGERHPTVVVYSSAADEAGARAIARVIRARRVVREPADVRDEENVFRLASARGAGETFVARLRFPDEGAASPVEFSFAGDGARLARETDRFRFRYWVGTG